MYVRAELRLRERVVCSSLHFTSLHSWAARSEAKPRDETRPPLALWRSTRCSPPLALALALALCSVWRVRRREEQHTARQDRTRALPPPTPHLSSVRAHRRAAARVVAHRSDCSVAAARGAVAEEQSSAPLVSSRLVSTRLPSSLLNAHLAISQLLSPSHCISVCTASALGPHALPLSQPQLQLQHCTPGFSSAKALGPRVCCSSPYPLYSTAAAH